MKHTGGGNVQTVLIMIRTFKSAFESEMGYSDDATVAMFNGDAGCSGGDELYDILVFFIVRPQKSDAFLFRLKLIPIVLFLHVARQAWIRVV